MLFLATLSHDTEHCWLRPERERRARQWVETIDERAEKHGVELRGAYVTPNEHTFYIVMEADDFESVTGFLGTPLLQDHDGRIAPVLQIKEGLSTVFGEAE